MTKTAKFNALRDDGSTRDLLEFLEPLSGSNMTWSILEFDGVGIPPNGMNMAAFSELVRSLPSGLILPWNDLLEFAKDVHQTYDCMIVAVNAASDIDRAALENGDYSKAFYAVNSADISYWNIWSREG